MNGRFVKIYGTILTSSIWMESSTTRIVWITLLASADANGFVEASLPGLAHVARVSLAECEEALAMLSKPDPYSKNPDHEGRRVEAVRGGWCILNYQKYREHPAQTVTAARKGQQRDRESAKREAAAERSRRYRLRKKTGSVTPSVTPSVTRDASRSVTPVTRDERDASRQALPQTASQPLGIPSLGESGNPRRDVTPVTLRHATNHGGEGEGVGVGVGVEQEQEQEQLPPPPLPPLPTVAELFASDGAGGEPPGRNHAPPKQRSSRMPLGTNPRVAPKPSWLEPYDAVYRRHRDAPLPFGEAAKRLRVLEDLWPPEEVLTRFEVWATSEKAQYGIAYFAKNFADFRARPRFGASAPIMSPEDMQRWIARQEAKA